MSFMDSPKNINVINWFIMNQAVVAMEFWPGKSKLKAGAGIKKKI